MITMDSWTKNCPKCGKKQEYSSWDSLRFAIRKNTICNPCRAASKKVIPENGIWKRVCKCGEEMIYSCRRSFNTGKRTNAVCRKCATKESGKTNRLWMKNDKYRNKMSKSLKMVWKTNAYGEATRQKWRENKLRQIRQQGIQWTYNPDACRFMDKLNDKFGWNLQHAMNGGEIQVVGYMLDGYDKNKNIIFEYDEPKHRTLSHRKRDREREIRIIKVLSPSSFFRYDEKDKKLMEIIDNKEVIFQHQ